jgi:hypothetical protein
VFVIGCTELVVRERIETEQERIVIKDGTMEEIGINKERYYVL